MTHRSWSRSTWRSRGCCALAGSQWVALLVPFRPQREQDRAAQLTRFLRHIAAFVCRPPAAEAVDPHVRFLVLVAQQSEDGRKFNRGQLLNAAYREARRIAGDRLVSVVFHDVDLLPPPGLRSWYASAPDRHAPIHLAGRGWGKYDMPGYDFFGGVTAFHPDDVSSARLRAG